MTDAIIHSYAGRYQWEVGREVIDRVVPANAAMSKLNPYVPSLGTAYETYYTKDGAYVGNPRGGATRVVLGPDGKPLPFDWNSLEKRTVYVRNIAYDFNDPKRYNALQPMRDNYNEWKSGKTIDNFLSYEIASLQNLAVDYYNQFAETAQVLGEDVKRASIVDGIGVLLTTVGTSTSTTGIGAVVAGVGWLTQLLSGKKKLSKELQSTLEQGQKDLAEISKIFNEYTAKEKTSNYLLYLGLAALGVIVYKSRD